MMSADFTTQVRILFRKTIRIAFREHFYKSFIFAAVIGFAVMAVVSKGMFDTYNDTQSGFFTLMSACIWIGIFNTIQSICKEHEIIHADTRSGMMVSAYVIALVMWQVIVCLCEALILFLISNIFVNFNKDPLVFGSTSIEYFITIFLLLLGSACLGLMMSGIAENGTMAMVMMPFVLIVQLILCGVLFELKGAANVVSYITYSKWGMSAFGSVADLNGPHLPLVLPDGRVMPDLPKPILDTYSHTASTLLTAWIAILIITVVNVAGTIIALKYRNRDS